MQQLMTVKEYAQLKRISENTVRRRIKSGLIEVEWFGRAVRIVPDDKRVGYELVDLPAYLKGAKPLVKNRRTQRIEAVSDDSGNDF
jgi:excisionase family DNA binding protein